MHGRHLVLLVDDNESFRSRIEGQLVAAEYDVLCARDGAEALSMMRDIRPDIVVTDLEMPRLDGLAVCRTLRELRAYDAVPLILCTGADNSDGRVHEARLLVGVTVVHKPIDGSELAAMMDDLLGVPEVALHGHVLRPPADLVAPDHASGLLARIASRN